MSSSIDPLATLIASVGSLIDPPAGLIASVAMILWVFCTWLAWRQRRRLVAIQTQLDNLSKAVLYLEADRERSLITSLNLPRYREPRKSSNPSSDALEEKMNEGNSERYVVAPKTALK